MGRKAAEQPHSHPLKMPSPQWLGTSNATIYVKKSRPVRMPGTTHQHTAWACIATPPETVSNRFSNRFYIPPSSRDALEGKGPQKRPQKRLDRRLEEVAKAVGGGDCRLQMPLKLALGVRATVAGHRLGALEGGGGGGHVPSLPMHPCPPASCPLRCIPWGGCEGWALSSPGPRPLVSLPVCRRLASLGPAKRGPSGVTRTS